MTTRACGRTRAVVDALRQGHVLTRPAVAPLAATLDCPRCGLPRQGHVPSGLEDSRSGDVQGEQDGDKLQNDSGGTTRAGDGAERLERDRAAKAAAGGLSSHALTARVSIGGPLPAVQAILLCGRTGAPDYGGLVSAAALADGGGRAA